MYYGFFNHQYFWKVLVDVLVFWPTVTHLGKTASEITSLGWI